MLILGNLSLSKYRRVKAGNGNGETFPSIIILIMCLLLSGGVTYIMYDRYSTTGKIMPAGMVMGISGSLALFYLFKVATYAPEDLQVKAQTAKAE